jgi:hypothetical protein
MSTFIKAIRSETASFLDFNPNANHLLNVIARRSRRTECKLNSLSVGECFIGFKSVGLTEQQYRTAKKQLQKIDLVSFRVARKLTGGVTSGVTVAKLLDSRVYDINIDEGNATVTPTQRQPNANLTSNKNDKNDNNEKNDKNKERSSLINEGFNHFWKFYKKKADKKNSFTKFKLIVKKMSVEGIEDFVDMITKDCKKRFLYTDKEFVPNATTYLNGERWNDEIIGSNQNEYRA